MKRRQATTTPEIPGREHAHAAQALLDDASDIHPPYDETSATGQLIAQAQVRASLAIYEALATIAAELS